MKKSRLLNKEELLSRNNGELRLKLNGMIKMNEDSMVSNNRTRERVEQNYRLRVIFEERTPLTNQIGK